MANNKNDAGVKALKALVGDKTPIKQPKNPFKTLCGLAIVAMIVTVFYGAIYSYLVDHLKDVSGYTPHGLAVVVVLAFIGGAYYFLNCDNK